MKIFLLYAFIKGQYLSLWKQFPQEEEGVSA